MLTTIYTGVTKVPLRVLKGLRRIHFHDNSTHKHFDRMHVCFGQEVIFWKLGFYASLVGP